VRNCDNPKILAASNGEPKTARRILLDSRLKGISTMRGLLLLMLAGLVAYGADDDWAKVKALKTGAELQVYKRGSTQPIAAQMDELTDENLVVIVKKAQTAIPREQIDRIDARPARKRVTKETTTKQTVDPDGTQNTSTSTGYSFGSKPNFETVYRRPPAAPKK